MILKKEEKVVRYWVQYYHRQNMEWQDEHMCWTLKGAAAYILERTVCEDERSRNTTTREHFERRIILRETVTTVKEEELKTPVL